MWTMCCVVCYVLYQSSLWLPDFNKLILTLWAGPSRRFKRLCELFQSVLLSSSRGPPTARRISSDLASNSSSSSYNSIDRLSPTPSNDDVCLTTTSLYHYNKYINNNNKTSWCHHSTILGTRQAHGMGRHTSTHLCRVSHRPDGQGSMLGCYQTQQRTRL